MMKIDPNYHINGHRTDAHGKLMAWTKQRAWRILVSTLTSLYLSFCVTYLRRREIDRQQNGDGKFFLL